MQLKSALINNNDCFIFCLHVSAATKLTLIGFAINILLGTIIYINCRFRTTSWTKCRLLHSVQAWIPSSWTQPQREHQPSHCSECPWNHTDKNSWKWIGVRRKFSPDDGWKLFNLRSMTTTERSVGAHRFIFYSVLCCKFYDRLSKTFPNEWAKFHPY